MNIGQKLRVARKQTGLTQDQVSEKINVTRQTLSNWEVGKNYPDIDSIIALSHIYQLSLDELLLGKIYFRGVNTMKTQVSQEQLESIINAHYPDATDCTELGGGLVSHTIRFDTHDTQLIFQAGNRLELYQKEWFVYNRFRKILPVRNTLGVYETDGGIAYTFSEFIEGKMLFDLSDEELFNVVPSVMDTFELLESIDVSDSVGYGPFDPNGHAVYPTWSEYIAAVFNEDIYQWSRLASNGLNPHVVTRALSELSDHMAYIPTVGKNFVHGDFGSYNLLAQGSVVSGIIDWSLSLYGDHLYEKANLLFWNEVRLQPLITEITRKYITSKAIREIVYCYVIRIGLEEIHNTVIRKEIGYNVEWVASRLQEVMDGFL